MEYYYKQHWPFAIVKHCWINNANFRTMSTVLKTHTYGVFYCLRYISVCLYLLSTYNISDWIILSDYFEPFNLFDIEGSKTIRANICLQFKITFVCESYRDFLVSNLMKFNSMALEQSFNGLNDEESLWW